MGRGADGVWVCALGLVARDRFDGCVISAGQSTWIISAGDVGSEGERDRSAHWNVLRARCNYCGVEIYGGRLHLVRSGGRVRDIFGGSNSEPDGGSRYGNNAGLKPST